jgi:chromate reductase
VLQGKTAAIMGASPGRTGTARAQLALRQSLVFTQTMVLPGPEVLVGEAGAKFGDDGKLKDESTRKFVRGLLERLVSFTEQLRGA